MAYLAIPCSEKGTMTYIKKKGNQQATKTPVAEKKEVIVKGEDMSRKQTRGTNNNSQNRIALKTNEKQGLGRKR